jgi:transposase
MIKSIDSYSGIYLACGNTDLRKSVDGLATIVKQDFGLDPFGNYLFLFCNRGRNRMKVSDQL